MTSTLCVLQTKRLSEESQNVLHTITLLGEIDISPNLFNACYFMYGEWSYPSNDPEQLMMMGVHKCTH